MATLHPLAHQAMVQEIRWSVSSDVLRNKVDLMLVKPGQIWIDSQRNEFTVLHVLSDEAGHVWIHYRDTQAQEYSCYEESFINRFNITVNEK